jgi:hypothetical protein
MTKTKKVQATAKHATVTAATVVETETKAPEVAAPVTATAAAVTAEPAPVVAAAAAVTTASPLADRVAQAIVLIKAAIALLALNAPALTAAQRKSMEKLRKGGDRYIPQLAQIATSFSVQIRTQPTATMLSAIQLATELQPLITTLAGFLQEVQDTGFQAQSDSWSTATTLYSVLKRMSRKDPSLKTQLAPVSTFFAFRRPVTTAKPAAAKPGKESRRDAKEVAKAEEVVAEKAAPAGPTPPAPHA